MINISMRLSKCTVDCGFGDRVPELPIEINNDRRAHVGPVTSRGCTNTLLVTARYQNTLRHPVSLAYCFHTRPIMSAFFGM